MAGKLFTIIRISLLFGHECVGHSFHKQLNFFHQFYACNQDMSSGDTCDLLQAKVGRLKESDSSLQRLRGKNADIYKEATEIRV